MNDPRVCVGGVETICAQLTELGATIAPATYYEHHGAQLTRRAQRDAALKVEIARVHAANYGAYGARKVWLTPNRERPAGAPPIARCTVERLMADLQLTGAVRGTVKRTTIANPTAPRAADPVERRTAQLVLDALEHAVWTRTREGRQVARVVAHHDHGSQYTSLAYSERLAIEGMHPSMGAVGSSYDNALAETLNDLYTTELIKPRGPWRTVDQVEVATAEWIDWFNHRRLYQHCGDIPPAAMEAAHHAHQPHLATVGGSDS